MPIARQNQKLLETLARLRPELWELIHPHVPYVARAIPVGDRLGRAPLNPQPLPPLEVLRLAAQNTARGVAEAAISAQVGGRDAREVLMEVGDDWCPLRPKFPFPWPRRWPFPFPRDERLEIDPEVLAPAVQAEAALIFQSYASGIEDEALSAAFGELADRMMEAATAEAN